MVAGFGGVITKLVQPFDAQNDCSFKIKFWNEIVASKSCSDMASW
jgi:hypothetical protein